MVGKIEQCVCIKFCMNLGKFATETLQMLHEAFGEQVRQLSLNGIHISRPVKCQLKMMNGRDDQAPAKRQKMLKIQELVHKVELHNLIDTIGISYGVCQEILTLSGPVANLLVSGF
jgi:hypothetical protein